MSGRKPELKMNWFNYSNKAPAKGQKEQANNY